MPAPYMQSDTFVQVRMNEAATRQVPVGAEVRADGVHLRVWAPRRRVAVLVEQPFEARIELTAEDGGYHAGLVDGMRAGARYRIQLDGEAMRYPDPASRFQPEGPHGPSEVVDAAAFAWSDQAWRGIDIRGQVIYELHLGTFTREGTYAAAAEKLPLLADVGVTCVELMPLAEFPGRFGWGYDGVDLYAPSHLYGTPDDLRRFVDTAHALGLAVIHDVVYNHLGPDGNFLKAFSPDYFTDRYTTEWGEAINYDGPGAAPVREFFVENAAYWIREFHFDGLRLDATQSIFDTSDVHVLAAIAERTRAAANPRRIILVAENEPQDTKLVRPRAAGGYGLDALWNDDLHHSIVVAATGHNEAYYTDHHGSPQELVSAIKWGYLFQGQRYAWQEKRRGTPGLDLEPSSFVVFLENHDQVANTARGCRLHQLTTPGRYRALSALVLLAPGTPLLFQGQEFASSRPFHYIADHNRELNALVRAGRGEFLEQFPSITDTAMQARLADPGAAETFAAAVLDWRERERHAGVVALYRDLLALRRTEQAFAGQVRRSVDGAVLGPEAFVLRFFHPAPGVITDRSNTSGDRLLIVNLGRDMSPASLAEPLMAPPPGCRWTVLWSSEHPAYGGGGTPPIETDEGCWRFPGHAALVMGAVPGELVRGINRRRTA